MESAYARIALRLVHCSAAISRRSRYICLLRNAVCDSYDIESSLTHTGFWADRCHVAMLLANRFNNTSHNLYVFGLQDAENDFRRTKTISISLSLAAQPMFSKSIINLLLLLYWYSLFSRVVPIIDYNRLLSANDKALDYDF